MGEPVELMMGTALNLARLVIVVGAVWYVPFLLNLLRNPRPAAVQPVPVRVAAARRAHPAGSALRPYDHAREAPVARPDPLEVYDELVWRGYPLDDELTYAEVARRTGLDPQWVHALLRYSDD